MSHQDWKVVTFDTKKSPDKKQISSQLPSKREYTMINKDLPLVLQQVRMLKVLRRRL